MRSILRLTRTLCFIISVLCGATSNAVAQGTASISGTVTDAVTAAPLTGTGAMEFVVRLWRSDGSLLGSQATGAAGEYSFLNLAAGTYFVTVTTGHSGYIAEAYDNLPCISSDCTQTSGSPIALSAGQSAIANFGLSRGGSFSGTVRRASDSQPLNAVAVGIYTASTSWVRYVSTAADGTYTATGLPAGVYYARVTAQGRGLGLMDQLHAGIDCPVFAFISQQNCPIASGTPIVVTDGGTTAGIDFALNPYAVISGRIFEEGSGAPVANAVAELYFGDRLVGTSSTTGNNYSFSDIPPGRYRIRSGMRSNYVNEWYGGLCVGCDGTPQTITAVGGVTNGDFDITLGVGGQISGMMRCLAAPPFGWTLGPSISAYNAATGALVRQYDAIAGCTSDHLEGPYTISGLPSGTYTLIARDAPVVPFGTRVPGGDMVDQLYPGIPCVTVDCDPRRGLPVTVVAGSTTAGIDLNMAMGASSQGFFGGNVPPHLRLFDTRGVELFNVRRLTIAPGFPQDLTGVPPGTYFATLGSFLHGRGYCANCPPTAGKPIVIQPGQRSFTLDFNLTPAITVSGSVRDETGGGPLSMVTVTLLSESGMSIGTAVTDISGRYSINTNGPGSYFLRSTNDRGYVDEVYPDVVCGTCDIRAGTPVVVGSTTVTGIDFTLGLGGVVSGRIAEASGTILAGTPVSMMTPSGALAGRTETRFDGTFRLAVPTGTYRARAEATIGHGAELFQEDPCTSAVCDVMSADPIVVTTGALRSGVDFTPSTCNAMTLSPALLATGLVGRAYRQVFTVSGGVGPMLFQVTTGTLPEGLAVATDGVLSGTPSVAGRSEFSVSAIDSAGCGTARALTVDVQACAFTLSPTSASVAASGGNVTVAIGDSCGSLAVDVAGTFVAVESSTANQVVLTVAPNPGIAARSAAILIGRRAFIVNQGGVVSTAPFGLLETPQHGAQVSGSLALGGWALDDLEVRRVQIYRDPVSGEGGQVYLGDAVFVPGARPDVRMAYPTYPLNDRAGWGFLILTNMLPNQGNGVFQVYAYADDFEGNRVLLGARTVVVANSTAVLPFGTIDTPAQGATIAGASYVNFGWALAPQPKIIPTDGSTIFVMVDGVSLGAPVYNQFRGDIAALFPGYANAGGAVGYRAIDTTALAEGQHTIAWIVYDSQGAGDGIGSRYFTVANSADAQGSIDAGVEAGRRTESLASMPLSDASVRRVSFRATDSLALPLETAEPDAACPATWAGYRVDDKTLEALPVGASIDRTGTFYWQPGVSFKGVFDLMFIRTSCDGTKRQLPVQVTIR